MTDKVEMNSYSGNRPNKANGGAQNALVSVPTEVKLLNKNEDDDRGQWSGKLIR